LARLACARENQPYVVPVYLAYHERPGEQPCFYGFTTPGQKIDWMRANPLVCVEVDEITTDDQWVSVVAFGRYEELSEARGRDKVRRPAQELPLPVSEGTWVGEATPETQECGDERHHAWQVLKALPEWWQPASTAWAARARSNPAEPFVSVYYSIRLERVTGHQAIRDARAAISYAVAAPSAGSWDWLRRTLSDVFGSRSKKAGSAS
jgi:nitroimidazol reductase NimA-like FMN-containing flavoprotein (pyridoxamine 5'-phosphate oxidase superfamily)